MNVSDFELIAKILRERSGLVLTREKAYLLESRLNPVARRWNFKGFDDLAQAVRIGRDNGLVRDVIEAMTTNETFFFRDAKPFDQFRDVVLPHLLATRASKRSLRIWCAACSTGQEPYSLAMILKEAGAATADWNIDILATDLSTEVLDRAVEGLYSQFEVQRGLPIALLVKYFDKEGDRWRLKEEVRRMVQFKQVNLLEDQHQLGRFDVVLCRNVLIYFDPPTKTKVLDCIADLLSDDGFLFLGGAETVLGISDRFRLMDGHRGIYGPAPAQQPSLAVAAG